MEKKDAKNKYFCSVLFFKHLILGLLFIILPISLIFNIMLVFAYHSENSDDVLNEFIIPPPQLLIQEQTQKNNFKVYQDLYVEKNIVHESKSQTVYLTFDDGPCANTIKILDTLKKHQVKATFFLVGNTINEDTEYIVRRIVKEGHAIGIHSETHNYEEVYASVDSFLDDFYKVASKIKNIIGYYPSIYRFIGGSINNFNMNTYQDIVTEMNKRGFVYYDWNVSADDAIKGTTTNDIINNVVYDVQKKEYSIVLFHDTKYKTVEALETIINQLKDNYEFKVLTSKVAPIQFRKK